MFLTFMVYKTLIQRMDCIDVPGLSLCLNIRYLCLRSVESPSHKVFECRPAAQGVPEPPDPDQQNPLQCESQSQFVEHFPKYQN